MPSNASAVAIHTKNTVCDIAVMQPMATQKETIATTEIDTPTYLKEARSKGMVKVNKCMSRPASALVTCARPSMPRMATSGSTYASPWMSRDAPRQIPPATIAVTANIDWIACMILSDVDTQMHVCIVSEKRIITGQHVRRHSNPNVLASHGGA